MAIKEFKTIEEQIELLKSRGLIIDNLEQAKIFLYNNNYYRVSGYSLTMRDHDTFYPDSTFQNIIDIYEFDHELRNILLKNIEKIEIKLKSIYAYEFAKEFGPNAYIDSGLFIDNLKYDKIIEKVEEQKKRRLPHEPYLKHFVEELDTVLPIWAYIDLFSIHDVSTLYSISADCLKNKVAEAMGLTIKGDKILSCYLHSLTIIRNLCAHGNRLYNRIFEQKPSLNSREKKNLIVKKDGIIDNEHLYGFMFILKRLLSLDDFNKMKHDIVGLTLKYPFVNMKYYGFRTDWKTII